MERIVDRLNDKQRRVVWIALAIAVGMFIFPPKQAASGDWDAGYIWLWQRTVNDGYAPVQLDYGRLLVQYLLVGAVALVAISSLKTKTGGVGHGRPE